MECENIDFNADKIKQYEAVRKVMNSASLKISSLSLQIRLSSWEICSQRQVSLQFHHLVGCYYPKKLKIERRQKAKLREKQCAYMYFHDSCSRRGLYWFSWDSSRAIWLPKEGSNGLVPDYIGELFNFKNKVYSLRNADFDIPRYSTVRYGKHSIRYLGPYLWSRLISD